MDERAQGSGLARLCCQALQVGAWLAQALAETLDVADPEALADESVEVDAAGDDVPAGFLGGELPAGKGQRAENLGLDEREVVAAPVAVGERSALVEVTVALKTPASSRHRLLSSDHLTLGFRGDHDSLDAPDA